MNVTGVPVVPLAGPAIVTVSASGEIETVAEAVAVAEFASVAVTEMVLLPFVE